MLRFASLAFIAWFLVPAAAPADADQPGNAAHAPRQLLTGTQLRDFLTGHTLTGQAFGGGGAYWQTFNADGTVRATSQGGTLTGTWRIDSSSPGYGRVVINWAEGGEKIWGLYYDSSDRTYRNSTSGLEVKWAR
jgi:hypothetical protein